MSRKAREIQITGWLAVVVFVLAAGVAQGATIGGYDSGVLPAAGQAPAADPATQGWAWSGSGNAWSDAFDSGDGGWRTVDGTSTAGSFYQHNLSGAEQDRMNQVGWTLKTTLSMDSDAINSGGGFVDNYYLPPNQGRQNNMTAWIETVSGKSYIVQFCVDAASNLLAFDRTASHQLTTDGSAYDNFKDVTIAYDAATQTAVLSHAGSDHAISDAGFHSSNRMVFGASSSSGQGSAIWNQFTLETNLPTKHSADFPYRYEFDVQPNTQDEDSNGAVDFWPGWDIGAIAAGVASVAYTDTNRADSVATDFALSGNNSIWREHFLTGDWTVETGLRITTPTGAEGASGSIAMLLATNADNQENFWLRVGRNDMRITLPGGGLQTIDTGDNTADFVAIRVARVDGKHYVWRDGVLLNASEAPADGYDWAPNTVGSGGLRTSFGIDGRYFSSSVSGLVDFDYIRMDPTGAMAPGMAAGDIPEPATLTLGLLGVGGVLLRLRRRRLAS